MASSKWKKVKVKVGGKMVDRWTNGKSFRRTKPAQTGAGIISNAVQNIHDKLGGNRGPSAGWKAAARQQRLAKKNGTELAPRVRKPKHYGPGGNPNGSGDGQARRRPGTAKDAWYQKGKVYGDQSEKATKPTKAAKTSSTRSTTRSSSTSTRSSSSAKSTRAKQSSSMDKNMAAWAKANPALAKKVKKGQSGYAAIQKALGNAPAAPKSTGAFKPGGTSKFPAGRTSTNKPQTGTNANPFKPSGSSTFPTRSSSVLKPAGKVPATAKPAKSVKPSVTKGISAGKRADAQ